MEIGRSTRDGNSVAMERRGGPHATAGSGGRDAGGEGGGPAGAAGRCRRGMRSPLFAGTAAGAAAAVAMVVLVLTSVMGPWSWALLLLRLVDGGDGRVEG